MCSDLNTKVVVPTRNLGGSPRNCYKWNEQVCSKLIYLNIRQMICVDITRELVVYCKQKKGKCHRPNKTGVLSCSCSFIHWGRLDMLVIFCKCSKAMREKRKKNS